MRLKTSCFNPSLAKNSLRRFWPLPVCAALAFLLTMVLPYYTHMREITQDSAPLAVADSLSQAQTISDDAVRFLSDQYYLMCFLLAGAALVSAMLLFHHLHSRREIQFYLALPVGRGGLFGTCALMGFLFIALPLLLANLAVLGISLSFGVGTQAALRFLAGSMLAFLCFYGMALVACVMAGQSFGAFLLYCGLHGAVAVIWLGACQVGQSFIPGFDGSLSSSSFIVWLIPLAQLMRVGYYTTEFVSGIQVQNAQKLLVLELHIPLIYGLVGLGLIILAAALYQLRKAETSGEMISFSVTRWLSKIMAAMAVGLGGTLLILVMLPYSGPIPFEALLAMVLVITAIGWVAAEMIIQKSFRVFHTQSVIPCSILLCCMAALMLGVHADMTGYIHRLPELSTINSASVNVSHGSYNYVPVSPEDARVIHEAMLSHMDQLRYTANGDNVAVSISYGTKEGKTIDRTYYFPSADVELSAEINAVMDKPDNVYSALFPDWPEDSDTFMFRDGIASTYPIYEDDTSTDTPSFTRSGITDPYAGFPLTAQETQTLYHAICQDIEDGSLLSPCHRYLDDEYSTQLGNLYFTLWNPADSAKKSPLSGWSASIDLWESMTHTIAAMKEMGFQFVK